MSPGPGFGHSKLDAIVVRGSNSSMTCPRQARPLLSKSKDSAENDHNGDDCRA